MRSEVPSEPRRAVYNRRAAVAYARRHVRNPNPAFANMDLFGGGGDCTNFTSQCLLAGGWPMDFRRTGQTTEWWYRRIGRDRLDAAGDDWWSCTWAVPENMFQYLVANHGEPVDLRANPAAARRLRLGDIVFYDWGTGRFGHSALVTAFRRDGEPLVTYRTLRPLRPQRNVHWSLRFRGRAARIVAVRLTGTPQVFPVAPDWSRLRPCDRRRLLSRRLHLDARRRGRAGRLPLAGAVEAAGVSRRASSARLRRGPRRPTP